MANPHKSSSFPRSVFLKFVGRKPCREASEPHHLHSGAGVRSGTAAWENCAHPGPFERHDPNLAAAFLPPSTAFELDPSLLSSVA